MKRRIRKELLDELLAGYEKPEDLTGPDGLLKQLTGALVERALNAELTDHLGHEPGAERANVHRPSDPQLDAVRGMDQSQGTDRGSPQVYGADTEGAALAALAEFERRWNERYPMVAQAWRANWERVRPFFEFGHEIRRIIYTTNAIESLNYSLRKITRSRGHFPNDEAALKLVYLVIRNVEKKWTRQPQFWTRALNNERHGLPCIAHGPGAFCTRTPRQRSANGFEFPMNPPGTRLAAPSAATVQEANHEETEWCGARGRARRACRVLHGRR